MPTPHHQTPENRLPAPVPDPRTPRPQRKPRPARSRRPKLTDPILNLRPDEIAAARYFDNPRDIPWRGCRECAVARPKAELDGAGCAGAAVGNYRARPRGRIHCQGHPRTSARYGPPGSLRQHRRADAKGRRTGTIEQSAGSGYVTRDPNGRRTGTVEPGAGGSYVLQDAQGHRTAAVKSGPGGSWGERGAQGFRTETIQTK